MIRHRGAGRKRVRSTGYRRGTEDDKLGFGEILWISRDEPCELNLFG
jgi:hypothetical protein